MIMDHIRNLWHHSIHNRTSPCRLLTMYNTLRRFSGKTEQLLGAVLMTGTRTGSSQAQSLRGYPTLDFAATPHNLRLAEMSSQTRQESFPLLSLCLAIVEIRA